MEKNGTRNIYYCILMLWKFIANIWLISSIYFYFKYNYFIITIISIVFFLAVLEVTVELLYDLKHN